MSNFFDEFSSITDKYLPSIGEGDTMATQIVTAVVKIIYRWFNDGDVYDNTYHLEGWENNLSSYANWLSIHAKGTEEILSRIKGCHGAQAYEDILYNLAEFTLREDYLSEYSARENVGTIYKCDGVYRFVGRY